MRKIISHMRTRPQHEQNRFSLIAAGSITAVLALIWIVNTRVAFRSALSAPATAEARGPISLIGEQFGFVKDRMTAIFNSSQE